MCAPPLELDEADALVSLLSQCPDYGLRVLEKGLSGLLPAPFGQAQFRVLVHLMSPPSPYGLKPLEMEEAAWDALDYGAQAEITAGWEARRGELGSKILHEIGGMERALPPADILGRARDWHDCHADIANEILPGPGKPSLCDPWKQRRHEVRHLLQR